MSSGGAPREPSGWRIVIVGTGGQGVLTAARVLCDCFTGRGHRVVSGQLHGMAQRGGSVQSSVIIDGGKSPVIASGRADFVLGFEPVETVRALPLMSARSVVYMNTVPVVPYILGQQAVLEEGTAQYPDVGRLAESIRRVTSQLSAFDATRLAQEAGSARAVNMIMLGCLLGSRALPCTADEFWDSVAGTMPRGLVRTNRGAFARGVELAEGCRLGARES